MPAVKSRAATIPNPILCKLGRTRQSRRDLKVDVEAPSQTDVESRDADQFSARVTGLHRKELGLSYPGHRSEGTR
jgi:hypothetical protein